MSHQTGIQASTQLTSFFSKCDGDKIRAFKVIIKDEELTLDKRVDSAKGSWESAYDGAVLPLLQRQQPCYVFYRLDSRNDAGYDWLFISWSPDDSPVRDKMLYASTKATLKKQFGGGRIKDELFGTQREDVSLKSYHKHMESEKAPQPLTSAEEVLQQIKREEASGVVDSKQQSMQGGVAFPVTDDVIDALTAMKDNHVMYIQLSIDMAKEIINLEKKQNVDVKSLASLIPADHARYHLFCFPHCYEGDYFKSKVFIYSVPGTNCPVRERMLYSSCKAPLLNMIESRVGLELARKIEIDDADELTEEFLLDEIHPKQNICKQKFAKPKGPTKRGARRLLKTGETE